MLGARLRDILKDKQWTATELARRAGVKRETVSMVLCGQRQVFSRVAAPRIHAAIEGAIPLLLLLGVESAPASLALTTLPSTNDHRVAPATLALTAAQIIAMLRDRTEGITDPDIRRLARTLTIAEIAGKDPLHVAVLEMGLERQPSKGGRGGSYADGS
jgi:transcriptional regulator with XRE-family HTH domain